MTKLTVQDTVINLINVNGNDYICLTDMLRAKDGDFSSPTGYATATLWNT